MPNEQKTDQGDELHISPPHDEHVWLVGDDGELIPLDDQGQPIELPPPPHGNLIELPTPPRVNRALAVLRRQIYLIIFLFVMLFLAIPATLLWQQTQNGGASPTPTVLTIAESTSIQRAAQTLGAWRVQVEATTSSAQSTVVAVMPMCSPLTDLLPDGVIVFAAEVQLSGLGQVMRVDPDGSSLCQMPNSALSTPFESLDANGRGGQIRRGNSMQHIDFYSGAIQLVYFPTPTVPNLTSPDGTRQVVIQHGSLTISRLSDGTTIPIHLPQQTGQILLAVWVAP